FSCMSYRRPPRSTLSLHDALPIWLIGRVFQRTPGSSRADFESRSDLCDHIACLLRGTHAGTRGQDIAVIIRQAFIDPQQIVLHWHIEVRSPEVRRAAKLAVPGMHVFVRQKSATSNAC